MEMLETIQTARQIRIIDLKNELLAESNLSNESYESGMPGGAVSGLPSLDLELNGAFSPGLHFIHGGPGVGKTAFCLQTAANCRCPSLYVTCEMGAVELLRRCIARVTSTRLTELKNGKVPPFKVMELFEKSVPYIKNLVIGDSTCCFASPELIHDWAVAARGDHKHILIVIDSLHSWAWGIREAPNGYETLNLAIDYLRVISQTLNCPILIIAERNRFSMNKSDVSSGKGTSKIEYSADTIIGLDRVKPDARKDARGEFDLILKISKNRHNSP